jgi:hypothetical protein
MPIASIEQGLEELRAGRLIILVNEEAPDSEHPSVGASHAAPLLVVPVVNCRGYSVLRS